MHLVPRVHSLCLATRSVHCSLHSQFELLGLTDSATKGSTHSLGRFSSFLSSAQIPKRDPISFHRYLYAHADPINRLDPSGQRDLTEPGRCPTSGRRAPGAFIGRKTLLHPAC